MSEELENVKQTMADREDNIGDTKPLVRIKGAIAKLKTELKSMEVRMAQFSYQSHIRKHASKKLPTLCTRCFVRISSVILQDQRPWPGSTSRGLTARCVTLDVKAIQNQLNPRIQFTLRRQLNLRHTVVPLR